MNIFPKHQSVLLEKISFDKVVTVQPATDDDIYSFENDTTIERCSNCKGFLSKIFKIDDDNSWYCHFCETKNSIKDIETAKLQIEHNNFEIIKDRQNSKSEKVTEILCIYISFEFEKEDIGYVKRSIKGALDSFGEDTHCLIFLRIDDNGLNLIVPPRNIEEIEPFDREPIKDDLYGFIEELDTKKYYNENKVMASLIDFNSLHEYVNLDLANFFFSRYSAKFAFNLIDKLSYRKVSPDYQSLSGLVNTIENAMGLNYVRFLIYINRYDQPPLIFKKAFLHRVDIIVSEYTDEISKDRNKVAGLIYVLSREDPYTQTLSLMLQKTRYGLLCRVRSNCEVSWIESLVPIHSKLTTDKVCLTSLLLNDEQIFAINVANLKNVKACYIQVIAVYAEASDTDSFCRVRIFSRKFNFSENPKEILDSINVKVLIWMWLNIYSSYKHDYIEVPVLNACNKLLLCFHKHKCKCKDKYSVKKIVKSLSKFDLVSDDKLKRHYSLYSIRLLHPSSIYLIPKHLSENNIILSPNGVEEDRTNHSIEAYRYRDEFPIFIPIKESLTQAFTD